MQTQVPARSNICISFRGADQKLLEDFEVYCQKNYTTKSGFVKQLIHKTINSQND